MAKGVTLEIQGLKELQKKLGKLPVNLVQEVDAEMGAVAKRFENRAVEAVPVDNGLLKGAITTERKGEMDYEVTAGKDYAAYVEFGTITLVRVPAELTAYAMQFKGKGIRKTGGMPARPYFFPQLPIARAEINKELKNVVERALK